MCYAKFEMLKKEAELIKTEAEFNSFIKRIEEDWSLSDRGYEALRHIALESLYND